VQPLNQALWDTVFFITSHLGIDTYMTYFVGMEHYQFWRN
jgi:hypothetical protein